MTSILFEKKLPNAIFQTFDGKPDFYFNEVEQVHGNLVVPTSDKSLNADGLFSAESKFSLAIKTADCLPIAVIGKKGWHCYMQDGKVLNKKYSPLLKSKISSQISFFGSSNMLAKL